MSQCSLPSITTFTPCQTFKKKQITPHEVDHCHYMCHLPFTDLELIKKLRPIPLLFFPSFLLHFPTLLTSMCPLSPNVEINHCCWHRLSLLLIDLFLGQIELLCSLLSFVLQPPSSSLQLLLKLLRLTKVNRSGCPLLLLSMAIDRGLRWVFIHLAGAWIECVGCLG